MKSVPVAACLLTALSLFPEPASAAPPAAPDYLKLVRAYADTLLTRGRDVYGEVKSPLIASVLDRKALRLFEGDGLKDLAGISRGSWGIRSHDRMLTGANPMHDQNFYQVLYALTALTGERRYAEEADRTLRWFLQHCLSPKTHLPAWGEHIGWDFHTETIIEKQAGTTHEYFRPWVLWPRCYKLAPAACARFARGLWEHQIGDHKTGNFSRHARWDRHGPGANSEYPRHGGFYIATWAHAYAESKDEVFLRAIDTLLTYFNTRRNPKAGAIPAESHSRSKGKLVWPSSNLSLAIDCRDSAACLPDGLARKLRNSAAKTDKVFLAIPHALGPKRSQGFVKACHADTLAAEDPRTHGKGRTHTRTWATGYGEGTHAGFANLCMLRYRQCRLEGYRDLVLAAADLYLDSEPDIDFPVYPGTLGQAIYLMLAARELTGEQKYLSRADHFARRAVGLFSDDSSPLPKASSKHTHYEAITRADTLMMALLKLWQVRNKPDARIELVYND